MDSRFCNVRQRNPFPTATRVDLLSLLADCCDCYLIFFKSPPSQMGLFIFLVSFFTEPTFLL